MDIIRKQRINYTITMTIIAAIFLLVVLGGLFGVVYASNDIYLNHAMERVLENPSAFNEIGLNCLFILDRNQSQRVEVSGQTDLYGDSLNDIVTKALEVEGGKFSYKSYYFVVANKEYYEGTLYVLMDRTSYHTQLSNTAIMVALLYCCSIIFVALLAFLSSSRLLLPVASAMKKQRDLIANASHELKTPLTIISTNLSVIKTEPDSTIEDNEKWISSISTQLVRMKDLINNMLELSKLEQSELPKQELNFSQIADGATLGFEAICFEKEVKLICDIQPEVWIYGETKSLERLIVILLDNAIKYCGDNGKVGIRLRADSKKAHLSVMNTGECISKEEAKHVFERFYRTDGARQNKDSQSFGLGLSIAAATVKAHMGEISCHGYDGKGTVFDVELPLLKKHKNGKPIPPKKHRKIFELDNID